MSRYAIHFEDSWNDWSAFFHNAQDYYDALDELWESPYIKVSYRGSYSWVFIEEEYYEQEEQEEVYNY